MLFLFLSFWSFFFLNLKSGFGDSGFGVVIISSVNSSGIIVVVVLSPFSNSVVSKVTPLLSSVILSASMILPSIPPTVLLSIFPFRFSGNQEPRNRFYLGVAQNFLFTLKISYFKNPLFDWKSLGEAHASVLHQFRSACW